MRNILKKKAPEPPKTGWRAQITTKAAIAQKQYHRARTLYHGGKYFTRFIYYAMYLFTYWKR